MWRTNGICWLEQNTSRVEASTYPSELHRDQLEALRFETLDDLANESPLDAIGLDHDKGALLVSGHFA